MPDVPLRQPLRGFTLTELVVVMGIITILIGMAMPAMSLSMRRADANSTANVIATIHQSQVRNARQAGGAGTVYGFSLVYSKLGSALGKIPSNNWVATSIVPWYITPDYSAGSYISGGQGYVTDTDLAQAIGGGIIIGSSSTSIKTTTSVGLRTIDFVDTTVPASAINTVVFPNTKTAWAFTTTATITTTTGGSTTTIASSIPNVAVHVAYEPGTGFVHTAVNTFLTANQSLDTLSGVTLAPLTDTNLHKPDSLLGYIPNQIEIVLYSMSNGTIVNRVILYQNGTYAIAGP